MPLLREGVPSKKLMVLKNSWARAILDTLTCMTSGHWPMEYLLVIIYEFRFWKMPIFGPFFDIKWSLTCDKSNGWRCGLCYLVLFFLLFNNSLLNQKFKIPRKKISAKYRFFRLFAGNYRFFLELEIFKSQRGFSAVSIKYKYVIKFHF